MSASGREHIQALTTALPLLDTDSLEAWGATLAAVLPAGGRLLVAGNGGSAAEAQHLASELVGRYRLDRAPLSAIALHADSSSVTAILLHVGFGAERLRSRVEVVAVVEDDSGGFGPSSAHARDKFTLVRHPDEQDPAVRVRHRRDGLHQTLTVLLLVLQSQALWRRLVHELTHAIDRDVHGRTAEDRIQRSHVAIMAGRSSSDAADDLEKARRCSSDVAALHWSPLHEACGARMARVRLLILGGSWFVGSEMVAAAARSGHEVTVFNRGRTPARYPDGVQVLHGDRESLDDLAQLARSGPWDAVVDVAGSVPTVVRDAARALREQVSRYVFISTVSVYREWPHRPVVESAPMHRADPDWDPGWRHWDAVAYGPLKSGCEAAIRREFPDSHVLIFRPGVVLGPGEYVGRVPWWLRRFERAGRILAPGKPRRSIQTVDVRDLASFVESLTAQDSSGVFNVAPPDDQETYGGLLAACASAVGTSPAIAWVDEDWLATQGVKEWTEIPLWRTAPGTWAMDSDKALRAGLMCRPLAATVADVWSWMQAGGAAVPHERAQEHGITSEREAALLAAWDATHQ